MPMSATLRRNRLIALVAAAIMVAVICGYGSHDLGDRPAPTGHCDWTMHFTGVAGSAPHPVALVKPVLASWLRPPVAAALAPSARRTRAHLARAPPFTLLFG
jgi:hypothetical protein